MQKKLMMFLLIAGFAINTYAQEKEDPKSFDLTEVGQQVPSFTFTTINGETYEIEDLQGKTVLINFFATWCGPCMKEMPELEAQVWAKFKDRDFMLISLGREHSTEEIIAFQKKKGFTFPLAPDPGREIYGKFFTKYIPRNVLLNKEGKIILQEFGYEVAEFAKLIELIDRETK